MDHIDTIDDAMTALTVARNREKRIHALRRLAWAAEAELERLLTDAPDWTCQACRMTWAGGTAPASLACTECGKPLKEERIPQDLGRIKTR